MADQKPNKLEIKVADSIPGAEYANAMQANHNRDEFHLIFLNLMGASGRVTGKIITPPGHFKRMLGALTDNLKKYEAKYGEIKEAETPNNNEIGFKG